MKFGRSRAHSSPFNGYFNGHISAVAAWGGTRNHPHTARPARPSPHGALRMPSAAWLAQTHAAIGSPPSSLPEGSAPSSAHPTAGWGLRGPSARQKRVRTVMSCAQAGPAEGLRLVAEAIRDVPSALGWKRAPQRLFLQGARPCTPVEAHTHLSPSPGHSVGPEGLLKHAPSIRCPLTQGTAPTGISLEVSFKELCQRHTRSW